ncbi:MAG TPA: hypothetical protein VJZ27_16775, partial [Aggregatilineales bacterium]|nr:hypothetical protein [Aggregatilineales bacterium]
HAIVLNQNQSPDPVECEVTTPANTNLVKNGDFDNQASDWNFYNVNQQVISQHLEFAPTDAANAVYQSLDTSLPPDAPMEMQFDMGNTSPSPKTVRAAIHNDPWSEIIYCTFTVPGNTPLQTYRIRGKSIAAWNNIWIDISDRTFDGQGVIQIDNVSLQYRPGLVVSGIECETPVPSNVNVVLNGDFSNGLNGWNFYNIDSQTVQNGILEVATAQSPNAVYQAMSTSLPTDAPVEATIQFNNTDTADKLVRLVIHSDTWANYFVCEFTIAGNNPGLQTYTMRGITDRAWNNAGIDIYEDTASGQGVLQVDNVSVQYKPGLSVTTTECVSPAPLVTVAPDRSLPETRVEAENEAVVNRSGTWITYTSEVASGGAYVYNSGATGENLSLRFAGEQLVLEYIQHPALGIAAIEVDGEIVQTFTLRGEQAFGKQIHLRDLADGDHNLRILSLEGMMAIDAILVSEVLTPEQLPTDATDVVERPTAMPSDSNDNEPLLNADSSELLGRPDSEPDPIEVPTETPNIPAAPLTPPILESLDDSASNWSGSGSWILTGDADADGNGAGWQASAGVEPAVLNFRPMLDLRSVPNPVLRFQTNLIGAYSNASVEVSFDGVTWISVAVLSPADAWQTAVVDLNTYRGQMIALRFVWNSRLPQPGDAGVDMWLLDEVRIENLPTPTTIPTEIPPTATSIPTDAP